MRRLSNLHIWSKRKCRRIPAHLITKWNPKGSLLLRSSHSLNIIMLYIPNRSLRKHFRQRRELHPGQRMMNRLKGCLILSNKSNCTMVTSRQCPTSWVLREPPTLSKVSRESSMPRRPLQLSCVAIKMQRVQWWAPQLAAVSKMMRWSRTTMLTFLKLTWAKGISRRLRSLSPTWTRPTRKSAISSMWATLFPSNRYQRYSLSSKMLSRTLTIKSNTVKIHSWRVTRRWTEFSRLLKISVHHKINKPKTTWCSRRLRLVPSSKKRELPWARRNLTDLISPLHADRPSLAFSSWQWKWSLILQWELSPVSALNLSTIWINQIGIWLRMS